MAGEDQLQVVAGMGGELEYYGPNDPRWDEPATLKAYQEGQGPQGNVLPVSPSEQPNPQLRPATLDEVIRIYQPKEYQRILKGTDESGNPAYFVVNALYRSPWNTQLEGHLTELPPELCLTLSEMEVLGPWLGLDKDEKVSFAGDNTLDTNPHDGTDVIFATTYNWKDYDSVKLLLDRLQNFAQVRAGQKANTKGWPTDIDDVRLGMIVGTVMAKRDQLFDQLPHKPTEKEMRRDGSITAQEFAKWGTLIGAGAAAGWYLVRMAVNGELDKLLPVLRSAVGLGSAVAVGIMNALKFVFANPELFAGCAVLGRLLHYGGPAAAAVLGSVVGAQIVQRGTKAIAGDDPDAGLIFYANGQDIKQHYDGAVGRVAFEASKGVYYTAFGFSALFSNAPREATQGNVRRLVGKSNRFGDAMEDHLVALMTESIDAQNQQIDWRLFQQKVLAFYRENNEWVDQNYDLLAYTAHRSAKGKRIIDLIAADGTIRDRDMMRDYLRKAVGDRLQDRIKPLMQMAKNRGLIATLKETEVTVHTSNPYTEVQQAYVDGMGGNAQALETITDVNSGSAAAYARAIAQHRQYLQFLNGGGLKVEPAKEKEEDPDAAESDGVETLQ